MIAITSMSRSLVCTPALLLALVLMPAVVDAGRLTPAPEPIHGGEPAETPPSTM